jgi:hypothetical protein
VLRHPVERLVGDPQAGVSLRQRSPGVRATAEGEGEERPLVTLEIISVDPLEVAFQVGIGPYARVEAVHQLGQSGVSANRVVHRFGHLHAEFPSLRAT